MHYFGMCNDAGANYFYEKIKNLKVSKSHTLQILDFQIYILRSVISNANSLPIQLEKSQKFLVDKYFLFQKSTAKKIQNVIRFQSF